MHTHSDRVKRRPRGNEKRLSIFAGETNVARLFRHLKLFDSVAFQIVNRNYKWGLSPWRRDIYITFTVHRHAIGAFLGEESFIRQCAVLIYVVNIVLVSGAVGEE